MKAIELFAGAGGLALGVRLAGFESVGVLEWDRWACDTIRENRRNAHPLVADWPEPFEGDVRNFDWDALTEQVDLVAGGPPCQPFSMGGKHRAHDDSRDMFPATVDIIRRLRPRAFIIENVKGLTRSSFANYFQYIQLQLRYPDIAPRRLEDWTAHYARLQEESTSSDRRSLQYGLTVNLVNAANYGVPQKRERVFMVGFRSDLGIEWSFPQETHSCEALLHDQWVTESYWARHGVPPGERPARPDKIEAALRRLANGEAARLPWRTVRDALIGLPDAQSRRAGGFHGHRFQPGARAYPGHTGSPLDLPAKAIKAGDHGVPGGENMMVRPDGTLRYFTVREAARLQTFPDDYILHGAWSETMRQIGNAVPVRLAQLVACSVAQALLEQEMRQLADVQQRQTSRDAA